MTGYYILAGIIFLVSWLVSNQLKRKFKKYSKVHLQNGMSGKEIAERMLADRPRGSCGFPSSKIGCGQQASLTHFPCV